MKVLDLKEGKKMLIFDEKDNLCPYCSYPLSNHENPNFRNQCYSCNSIASAIRNSPKDSYFRSIKIRPYPFEKIICVGEYYKLKESLKESKDPAHLLSLCLIHYKDHSDNIAFFSNLLKQKIESFIEDTHLNKKEIILCGVPDLESKSHQKIDLLCKEISKKTGLSYLPAIKKIKNIPTQHKKEKIVERYENVRGVYNIEENYKKELNNKIIFLIDDIVSTMASTYECAKELKASNSNKIYVFGLGRNIFINKTEEVKNEHS